MTPQEREREARERVRWHYGVPDELIDELLNARSACVRWEQQADAEGYTEGRP